MQKVSTFLLALVLISSVTCWWEVGHMAVSQIAQKQLKALNQTVALQKFTELVMAFANLTDGKSNSFVQAAVWADDIKQVKANYFDQYHFTDIVYDPTFLFSSMTEPQKDVNSITIGNACITVLKANKAEVTFQRAFMARYLLHLVGDIHQPLHSVTMYNSSYKTGDAGGNLVYLNTVDGTNMNSHAFMDSMALQQASGDRIQRPLTQKGKSYFDNLTNLIMKEYPVEYFGDLATKINVHDWTVQSYNHAVNDVYSFLLKQKNATKQWQDKMFKLCRQRVALAGYRLAATIAMIYK